jgi:hypothetical protein
VLEVFEIPNVFERKSVVNLPLPVTSSLYEGAAFAIPTFVALSNICEFPILPVVFTNFVT